MYKRILTLLTLLTSEFIGLKLAGETLFIWQHEKVLLANLSSELPNINFAGEYYAKFSFCILLIFVGQIILLVSLASKLNSTKLINVGLTLIWMALLYLLFNAGTAIILFVLLYSSLFLIFSVWLLYINVNKRKTAG